MSSGQLAPCSLDASARACILMSGRLARARLRHIRGPAVLRKSKIGISAFTGGMDLTFAPCQPRDREANVKSKIPPAKIIFASGPLVLTFAKVPANRSANVRTGPLVSMTNDAERTRAGGKFRPGTADAGILRQSLSDLPGAAGARSGQAASER